MSERRLSRHDNLPSCVMTKSSTERGPGEERVYAGDADGPRPGKGLASRRVIFNPPANLPKGLGLPPPPEGLGIRFPKSSDPPPKVGQPPPQHEDPLSHKKNNILTTPWGRVGDPRLAPPPFPVIHQEQIHGRQQRSPWGEGKCQSAGSQLGHRQTRLPLAPPRGRGVPSVERKSLHPPSPYAHAKSRLRWPVPNHRLESGPTSGGQ